MKRQSDLTHFFNRRTEAPASTSSSPSTQSESSESSVQSKRPKVVNPLDIGQFAKGDRNPVQSPLTERTKYKVLTNCWKPDENYIFPKLFQSGQSRAFKLHYLKKWP